ncbi:MAG: thioredoxin domain-containing protein [Terriglobia bacterium]
MRKFLILALSFVGLFDSLYLWWVYTSPSHPLVCLGTGCDVVRASPYAHLWGLPLPLYGAALYGGIALLCVAETLGGKILFTPFRYAILLVAGGGFIVSLVLTGIEAFAVHAWCAWCVLSAIVVTLILLLAIWRVARPPQPPQGASALNAVRGQFVLFLVALAVGIPAFVRLSHSGELAPVKPASAEALATRLVRPDSHATGDIDSPVTVVEFGDFECPMCRLAQQTVENALQQYGSRVHFVFRQFPLTGVHPQAEKAAEASECAAQQGQFWQAEKLFYEKQPDLSVSALESYAAELGLNVKQFDECLSSGSMKARVQQDVADGKALGVRGTPTFFIGDQMIVGPPNPAQFSQLIAQQISEHGLTKQAAIPAAPGSAGSPKPATPMAGGAGAKDSAGTIGAGGLGGGVFAQIQAQSALACSPDEAKLQKPSLIRTAKAEELFKKKAVFVDVRSASKFSAGHIAGAINIPVEEIGQRVDELPKDRVMVFYEGGEQGGSPDDVCAFSRAAARVALAQGFDPNRVKVYQDGFKAWKQAGLPVSP